MWLYIVIFLLTAIGLVYFYTKKPKKSFIENNEYVETTETPKAELYTFYTDWCPHSKKTLETLEGIKNNYEQIQFIEVNAEKDLDLANAYKVESYPTLILLYKNEKYMYDADLEDYTFDKFINTIMK